MDMQAFQLEINAAVYYFSQMTAQVAKFLDLNKNTQLDVLCFKNP